MIEDPDRCYQAAQSKDARFDGWFFCAVTSTGIYCRPSCPARTPKRQNVRFYPTAAAAQQAGFRACLRCRPDATPGSPEWNVRADVVARAMRLIRDGVVDREGVEGLARRLGYSTRQLNRLITAEVGTGPAGPGAGPAQPDGAHPARDDRPARRPRRLRRRLRQRAPVQRHGAPDLRRHAEWPAGSGGSERRGRPRRRGRRSRVRPRPSACACRAGGRSARRRCSTSSACARCPGWSRSRARRTGARCACPTGTPSSPSPRRATDVAPDRTAGPPYVEGELVLSDLRDLTTAVSRCRQLLDLDADPVAVWEALRGDARSRSARRARPGRRVPGTADGFELAVRAVIGQQVSVPGARTVAGRLVRPPATRCPGPTARSPTSSRPRRRSPSWPGAIRARSPCRPDAGGPSSRWPRRSSAATS